MADKHMKFVRGIVTNSSILPELIKLNLQRDGRKLVFNYWKPGYYAVYKNQRVFHPTDSLLTAATTVSSLASIANATDEKSILNIVHPGHISLETYCNINVGNKPIYLSIGTVDSMNLQSAPLPCKMIASKSFVGDCIALKRFPAARIPLFSLDTEKAKLATLKILEGVGSNAYSLLGEFGDTQGKNCSTAVYFCLLASGIRNLVDLDKSSWEGITDLLGTKIYIPETLADLVKKCVDVERKNAEANDLYTDFEAQTNKDRIEIQNIINELNSPSDLNTNDNDSRDPAQKPK